MNCPRCGTPLRYIENHPESQGYGHCDTCDRWVSPKEKGDNKNGSS